MALEPWKEELLASRWNRPSKRVTDVLFTDDVVRGVLAVELYCDSGIEGGVESSSGHVIIDRREAARLIGLFFGYEHAVEFMVAGASGLNALTFAEKVRFYNVLRAEDAKPKKKAQP